MVRGRRADRGRLLRNDPRAHPVDRRVRAEVSPRYVHAVTASAPAVRRCQEPVPLAERSRIGCKLAAGRVLTTVEIVPPRGVDPAPMFEQARQLKAAGVDAVNVPDGPRAQSRMGALLSALMIQREVGHRGRCPLRLPRPEPAGHAVAICSAPRPAGSATCSS